MPSAVESDVASADHPSALARLVGGLADRPVLSVAVVALAARLVFSVVSFVVHDAWLIPDESQYIDLAAHVADGRGAEAWYPFYGQSLYDSTWAFTAPIAFLYDLLSPTRLLGQLWALSFGVGTAAATTRLAMTVVAGRWAVGAGL
ncbi:MAG TPA: hypothetical protein VEA78_01005, partial [Acidimicrobiales bacterium]|nr:hypothetical protein [Acidimicrobiales bacterium]